MENQFVHKNLKDNEQYVKEIIGDNADIIYRNFVIPGFNNNKALLIYIDGLVNTNELDDIILKPLIAYSQLPAQKKLISSEIIVNSLMDIGVLAPSVKIVTIWNEAFDSLVSGDSILILDGIDKVFIFATRGFETRNVSEPVTENEVRGPRDGFVENIRSNTTLIRRRIRDYGLRFENMKIGSKTKTDLAIAYIDSLVNKQILDEVRKRLNRIKVDSILESGYLEEFIEDAPFSLFPQIDHTERPDKVAAAILSGRIAIIVDNTPFVLIVPTVLWSLLQASGDYYERFFIGNFLRWIRIIAMVLSLTMSSIYIMLTSFHQEMLPTPLALKIAAGREGVPFPAIIEAFLMETMFEILREAGIRIPKPIGQAVSIVGALVIGEAAVNAGLIAPISVIVVAVAGICSFAIPAYSLSIAFRLLRFPLILLTGIFGILGFLGGTIAITVHLLSLRSFGAPFLAPIMPFRTSDNKDTILRVPWWKMMMRPRFGEPQDSYRQKDNLKPKPPKK